VFLIIALLTACIFGITVLVSGDWLPGAIIVGSALLGLAGQLRRLSRHVKPSSPKSAT
jgi:hypothetical protein